MSLIPRQKPLVPDAHSSNSSELAILDVAEVPAPLRRRVLQAYAIGDAGTGMASALIGFYLFVFYTSIAALPAWVAGTVLMVVRLWDVLSDQLIGWLGDRTQGRLGPRIPWMLYCAFPLGISMALMWWVPPWGDWLRFSWFVVISTLFMAAYSGVNLPYSALATELTTNVRLRTRLNTARFTGSILASMLGLMLAALLTHQGAKGYQLMGCVAGSVLVCGSLLSAIGLTPAARYCRRPVANHQSLLEQLARIRRNGRFVRVVVFYLFVWSALQLMQPVSLIYLSTVMHLPNLWSTWMLIPFQISAMLGLWIWNSIAATRGRIFALKVGGSFWIALCLVALLLPALNPLQGPFSSSGNSTKMVLLILAVLGLGSSASMAYLLPWALLPDAIDADAEHPAGLYTAWMMLVQKFGSALSVFVLGALLSWSGYVASLGFEQSFSALWMVRLCMGLFPALMVILGVWVMRSWPQASKE